MKNVFALFVGFIFFLVMQPKPNHKKINQKSLSKQKAVLKNQSPIEEPKKETHFKKFHKPEPTAKIESDPSFDKLPDGHILATNIRAIDKKSFSVDMGEIIEESPHNYFIKPHSTHDRKFANVIYDKRNKRFYPVSAVLKVEGVDESLREKLIGEGLEEFYYHQELKTFFVQSTHSEVLSLYKDLTSQGLVAYLELIRGFNQKR